ncbi:MAG: hypothetical protein ACRDA4_09460 [Filifactoraceae bacterium]
MEDLIRIVLVILIYGSISKKLVKVMSLGKVVSKTNKRDSKTKKHVKNLGVDFENIKGVTVLRDIIESVDIQVSKLEKKKEIVHTNKKTHGGQRQNLQIEEENKFEIESDDIVKLKNVEVYDKGEIYSQIAEIKDIENNKINDVFKIKRSQLKKYIVMKEILDKPLANRQIRR